MKVIFIRHGESTGNAGIPSKNLALLELTRTGQSQAEEIAAGWLQAPDLIVSSPYLRTQQTAAPTMERFSSAPVEVWPIQEFTYLEPSRWNGTLSADRKPHIVAYWSAADPAYCDGPGAESFTTLLDRARNMLERLAALPADWFVLIFSHGQFIHAVRMLILHPYRTDAERMRLFWRTDGLPSVRNGELIAAECVGGEWSLKNCAENHG
jgi:broad specificity phosphatase PhoE